MSDEIMDNCPSYFYAIFIVFQHQVSLSYSAGFCVQPATNWNDGRLSCKADGLELAVVKDADKTNEVQAFLAASSIQVDLWMGLYYDTQTQLFRWVDNSYIEAGSYTNWASLEPNFLETDHCVRLSGVQWKTMMCTSPYYVLCEGGPETTTDATSCQSTKSNDGSTYVALFSCRGNTMSSCDCEFIRNVSSVRSNETDYLYRIDKRKTTAFINRHISKHDGRMSARLLGASGVVVICFVALIICFFDIDRLGFTIFGPSRKQRKHTFLRLAKGCRNLKCVR